jgi:membrane protein
MLRKLLDVFGFLRFVLRRWTEDRCPQIAASLTYTTLLALVPVFAIAVAMLSTLPFFEQIMVRLKIFLLLNLVPELAGKIIIEYMEPFARNAARVTGISFAALFVMGVGMMWAVDRSLNTIWRVRRNRPWPVSILAYVALLAIGPILVGISVTATTYLMTLSAGVTDVPKDIRPFFFHLAPIAVSTVAFFLAYQIVPHRRVPWTHALAGGFVAALFFEAMKEIFAGYVARVPTYSIVYGTFATIPLFLLWVYFSWLVILFGAEVTVSFGYLHGALWKRVSSPGARFRDVVELGRLLVQAKGQAVEFQDLQKAAAIPSDQLEDALHHLVDAGVVKQEGKHGFLLARRPEDITLGDLYRAVISPGARLEPDEWVGYEGEIGDVIDQFQALLNRPLAALRDSMPPEEPAKEPSGR